MDMSVPGRPGKMPGRAPKRRDDLVMGTNSSSIVSKRSVERIYFPDEPAYFRFFVPRYQRRAPLINRGYHLRMHLVDAMVRAFLRRPSPKAKVVVNLGCGRRVLDPLPWRTLARHAEHCAHAKFVDIDFPDLMARKRDLLAQTPELRAPLANLAFPADGRVLATSDQYCQIACDLRQLADLHAALAQVADIPRCCFIFVAEVSITYMEPEAADALIRWAGTLGDVEFCLLEQMLPDGPAHPFAQTMLQHFDKLNTPIRCVHAYPTPSAQQARFAALGWAGSRAWTLWEAWSDPLFLSAAERQALDAVEVFDEWEEFASFAQHYLLLYARNGAPVPEEFVRSEADADVAVPPAATSSIRVAYSPAAASKNNALRRFGGALAMTDVLGQKSVAHFFGLGPEGRLRSCDVYSSRSGHQAPLLPLDQLHAGGPAARSCFALVDLGDAGYLLAGGRTSPAAPFDDTWLFRKDTHQWSRSHSLPVPLFRHAAVRLGPAQFALVAGGKSSPTTVSPHYLLYHPGHGWLRCAVRGPLAPAARFGSLLLSTGASATDPCRFHGLLAGGMTGDGVVANDVVRWTVDVSAIREPTIQFASVPAEHWATQLLSRFGAVSTQADGWTIVAGGVVGASSAPREHELVRFRAFGDDDEAVQCLEYVRHLGQDVPRPVLAGASMISPGRGEVLIHGGGMTCFSMGTVWSKGVYSFRPRGDQQPAQDEPPAWCYLQTVAVTNEEPGQQPGGGPPSVASIPRVPLRSSEEFQSFLQSGQPAVFTGLDLGRCLTTWDLDALAERIGTDRKVVVHESTTEAMDFLAKNFRYSTQTLGEFVRGVHGGKRLYLRALSADKPSDAPANLAADFPTIAADFVLPPPLAPAGDRLFSSVLRVSGPVNMWLHYDVLANVYCQIRGSKRFYLFPPSDVTQLGFAPGASSSSIDVFSALGSSAALSRCRPHEALVGPGDVLFLPPLWLHTAAPVSDSSVAVNVFFRDLDHGYAPGRDVYGNRDLAAYEKARQDVAKTAAAFRALPRHARQFYLGRVADELLQAASE